MEAYTRGDVGIEDVIGRARQLPSGARFYRCALQVNPQHYSLSYRGQDNKLAPIQYAETMVKQSSDLGIELLAITDHNSVNDVDLFRRAAVSYDVTIMPGFELTSSDGVHVLCIYSPETAEQQLGRFLGEFGILEPSPSSDNCNSSFSEVLATVQRQGGITIAAHITTRKGLFAALSGQTRINAWRSKHLMAAQIPGSITNLPRNWRDIVQNRNPDYVRSHAAGERQAVALVNAKDIRESADLTHPAATCLIKMSELTIEGLRQAFLDPDSRIRLNSEPVPPEHTELVALAWEGGGFLDGAAIHFNQNLNVLIGGRGAGKSTVVESLRHVLDLDAIGEDARRAYQGIVRQVLRSGTKITLMARSHRPTERLYTIERTIPNPPVVRDDNGKLLNLVPKDIIPRVEVYGQHEISELSNSRENLTRLLHRFVPLDPSLKRRKASIRGNLQRTRRSVMDVYSELRDIEDRLDVLPSLQERLKRFQEAGFESRLREQSYVVREERVLNSVPQRLEPFRSCLETLRQELPIDRTFLSPKALQGLPGRDIISSANHVLEELSVHLLQITERMSQALGRAEEGVAMIYRGWEARKDQVEKEYQQILRDLQESAVDGEEFLRLQREIESLLPLRDRWALLQKAQTDYLDRRRSLLDEWEDLKAREFRHLDRAAQEVTKKLRNRVRVEVAYAGNRQPLFNLLQKRIGGRLSEAIVRLGMTPDLSLSEFVDHCRAGAESVKRAYGITPVQAGRLAGASEDVLMQIEELDLPPITTIQLNTAPLGDPPSWQLLENLSKGQKATAVLLLLLLESDSPLIIDQPEDDLDNRFITEAVVPRMREEKQLRQFVFSTHNANIPVLGDAELIVGLSASGEAEEGKAFIRPEHMGSIDAEPVRELVEDILEGGKHAFETRRLKYGF